jgi:predicted alpha/beta hydrolase
MPASEPTLGKAVGWNYTTMLGKGKTAFLSHEYDYPGKVALAQVSLQRAEGAKSWTVVGFHVQVATTQELQALRFSLIGKSPAHYIFLAAMIASLGLILAAMVKVVRAKNLKRKWLWLIASLFCLVGFQINWFSGAVTWKLIFGLLNAGAVTGASRFDPWMLSFSLPLGAILILTGVWAKPKPLPAVDTAF